MRRDAIWQPSKCSDYSSLESYWSKPLLILRAGRAQWRQRACWVMTHLRMSHVTRMNEWWHTHEYVMIHVWMSHVTHMNEYWHTYEWVMSHIWSSRTAAEDEVVFRSVCYGEEMVRHVISALTHINESLHTYEWVLTHIWMRHATHMKQQRGCWRRGGVWKCVLWRGDGAPWA